MSEGAWRRRTALLLRATVILLAAACASPQGGMTGAERDAMEARQLVERAHLTVESFAADPVLGPDFKSLLARAHGVFVAPQVLKGAFIVGASGGSGVLLARDEQVKQWNGPAFYTLGGVSFGLQAGGEASEVVLLPMTERGVTALLAPSVKLGADIGVAAGPVGGGMSAATANLSADILSYARSKGLYAGISLAGAVVANRSDWDRAYYGGDVNATDILIRRTVANPHAAPLIQAVVRASGG
jgi:lipid-binding SYLF domain-containing protein